MPLNISPDEARDALTEQAIRLTAECLPLTAALGRVNAKDVFASHNVPPFRRSPFDGYALLASDTENASERNPAVLEIIEEIPAGKEPKREVTSGKASKILTGAPVPVGADAVVKFEEVIFTDTQVKIPFKLQPERNIIGVGEDVTKGKLLVSAGGRLSAPMLGVLAGQGICKVEVYRKPAVTVFSTGAELAEPGQELRRAQIYNSNTYSIGAYIAEMGCDVIFGRTVEDDPVEIAAVLERAFASSDLTVTTGGVSVGDYDFVPEAVNRLGFSVIFRKVRFKPGGSMMAAVKDGKVLLALSGNPSAAVTGLLYVAAPYIRMLCGRKDVLPKTLEAALDKPLEKKSPKTRFLCGKLVFAGGQVRFRESNRRGNGIISSFVGCDSLAVISAGSPELPEGTFVTVYRVLGNDGND
ncbi:molybdopterin molybdenumtransferase MoeA [Synergistales bacterium]|nr:molybdopterin molybdenumtransferase MoeA [Synergistales bacterium]